MDKCKICGKDISSPDNYCDQCKNRYPNLTEARPTWQDLYFGIAKLVASRSLDPSTKVGAVIVKDGCVMGVGYNGAPRKFKYKFDWNSKEKYDYVIHAELNAVSNACSIGANVNGADIYLTMSPCHDCIKLLIQHQIKRVYYLNEYKDIELTKKIAENADIELIKVEEK